LRNPATRAAILGASAEQAGNDWPDRAHRAAVELSGVEPHGSIPEVQLLRTIRSIFEKQKTDRLSSEAIVSVLAEPGDGSTPNRQPLTKAQLARRLSLFEIRPTIVHRTRTQVRRGYLLQDFRNAFAQYSNR
jgi:hypothetical protein